eukprot:8521544-Lingulodinium_polyedra.AAC.1
MAARSAATSWSARGSEKPGGRRPPARKPEPCPAQHRLIWSDTGYLSLPGSVHCSADPKALNGG